MVKCITSKLTLTISPEKLINRKRKMKYYVYLLASLAYFICTPSHANIKNAIELPNSNKSCNLEGWNWENNIMGIKLHGSVTCYKGKINLKLYCNNQYLTNGYAYIKKAGNFRENFSKVKCEKTLTIKYSIE